MSSCSLSIVSFINFKIIRMLIDTFPVLPPQLFSLELGPITESSFSNGRTKASYAYAANPSDISTSSRFSAALTKTPDSIPRSHLSESTYMSAPESLSWSEHRDPLLGPFRRLIFRVVRLGGPYTFSCDFACIAHYVLFTVLKDKRRCEAGRKNSHSRSCRVRFG